MVIIGGKIISTKSLLQKCWNFNAAKFSNAIQYKTKSAGRIFFIGFYNKIEKNNRDMKGNSAMYYFTLSSMGKTKPTKKILDNFGSSFIYDLGHSLSNTEINKEIDIFDK